MFNHDKKFDFDELVRHQAKLPDSILAKIKQSEDGGFVIEILDLPGCYTQVENGRDLFAMVNDAVFTYFEIPEQYFPLLPRYFPAQEIRKRLQEWDKGIPADFLKKPIVFFQGVTLSRNL